MKKKLGIIGLGYVGLPLAYHFDKAGYEVVGLDISKKKISELNQGIDTTNEIGPKIKQSTIQFTLDSEDLRSCEILIVTVPTPINSQKLPDFTPLEKSSEMIGRILQPGQIVVYESTVYPGCTEEICLPILEKVSGLSCPGDFQIGYSPERINPGDKKHTVDKIIKVVAGIDAKTCDTLATMYETIITAGVHRAPTIQVAEASKIIENTQRDINIALMNELKQICDAADINVRDVLEAAGTKWNFLNFYPGLVGGHCIGVDPYWLAYKAQGLGLHPEIILSGRRINDNYPIYIAKQIIKKIMKTGMDTNTIRILVLGLTFKPDVPDFRNSKVAEMIKELKTFDLQVDAYDPYYEYLREYDMKTFELKEENLITEDHKQKYDVVIHAVPHKEFEKLDITKRKSDNVIMIDIKSI